MAAVLPFDVRAGEGARRADRRSARARAEPGHRIARRRTAPHAERLGEPADACPPGFCRVSEAPACSTLRSPRQTSSPSARRLRELGLPTLPIPAQLLRRSRGALRAERAICSSSSPSSTSSTIGIRTGNTSSSTHARSRSASSSRSSSGADTVLTARPMRPSGSPRSPAIATNCR